MWNVSSAVVKMTVNVFSFTARVFRSYCPAKTSLLWGTFRERSPLSLRFVAPGRIKGARNVLDSRKIKIPSRPGNNVSPAWRHWLICPMERSHRSRAHVALCSSFFDLPLSLFRPNSSRRPSIGYRTFRFPLFGSKMIHSSKLLVSFSHDLVTRWFTN